ncbi:hypothetical protein F2Q69_00058228 [Brassica cretica]|uniref:Uncharacterized protein n=1 Tax=Brassica cretica TaxID=69181 RepID=A0A8S9RGW3_BRACR|nr:hypothetical protein F2Q69_00058228 [Brassica cretica]
MRFLLLSSRLIRILVLFILDNLALFISLAFVVVIEQKAKKKLMWLACLFISIALVSLSFIVVDKEDMWLAICAMCYCVVLHRRNSQRFSTKRNACTLMRLSLVSTVNGLKANLKFLTQQVFSKESKNEYKKKKESDYFT